MTDKMKDELKNKIVFVMNKIQAYALWFLMAVLLGVWIGIGYCNKVDDNKKEEAIKLGGLVYKGKVYSINLKQVQ